MCRAGPDDRTVLHLAGPRLFSALIGLHEDLADLFAGFHDSRIHTAVHLIIPLAEELIAGAEYLRISRFVDIPFLQLILCLFIETLHSCEIGIPVPLSACLLLDKADASLDIFRGIFHSFLILIAHGERQMEDRQIREAAGHVGRSHDRTVTRHGGRDKAAAQMRKRINDKGPAFRRRHRAGICRKAEGFHRIDIRDAGQLVNLRHEEHRHQLIRDADQIREAGHNLTHGHLIEKNDFFIQLFAVAVLSVALGQEHQILRHITEDVVNHQMRHLQVAAAKTHGVLVHKTDAAHVRDHPSIPEGGVQGRNQILGEGAEEHSPHPEPFLVVIGGVLQPAPFAAYSCHSAFPVQAAEMLLAVFQEIQPLGRRHGFDGLKLFRNAAAVISDIIEAVIAELFPVRLFQHIKDNGPDFLQVFPLFFPVHIILCPEKGGIRIFDLCHYLTPPLF